MSSPMTDALELFNMILPVPNAIALVVELLDENIPVVKSKPPSASVPEVSVVVPVAVVAAASAKVVVPEVLLIINPLSDLPVLVHVPVPPKVTIKLVYVPPVLNVNEFTNIVVVAGVVALPVKSNVLK